MYLHQTITIVQKMPNPVKSLRILLLVLFLLAGCGEATSTQTADSTTTPSATDVAITETAPTATPTLVIVPTSVATNTQAVPTSAAASTQAVPTNAIAPKPTNEATTPPTNTAASGIVSPLTGLPVAAAALNRRPIVVMIDNQADARPQSGVSQASLVYEALAEGGISRYMAVFLDNDAGQIGPVRSARQYFVDLARAYRPFFMHFGGSPAALASLSSLSPTDNAGATSGIINLDGLMRGNLAWRSSARQAPHNAYTGSTTIRQALSNLNTRQDFGVYPHKDSAPLAERGTAQSISIAFLPGMANSARAAWSYSRADNLYSRSVGGAAQIDMANSQPIRAASIALMYTEVAAISNDDKGRLETQTTGGGKAVVIQDGKAQPATWKRPGLTDMLRFYGTNGSEIAFNRGVTWIEVVPTTADVRY